MADSRPTGPGASGSSLGRLARKLGRRNHDGTAAIDETHALRLALLSGRPYELSTDAWERTPAFGFDFLADAIAKVVATSAPQLTLAVYGRWGSGKTTLLHAVEARVRSLNFPVAWFDMWEYKNQQNVIAHLLDAIASALPQGSAAATGLARVARAAFAGASVSAGAVSFSGKDFLAEIEAFRKQPRVETSQLQQFVDDWRESRHAPQDGRIVVIVDNLDRCVPALSVGLLEQVTSLFGFPGVVFVLSAEKERLARAIEEKHELPEGEGDVYLEKIVQVEFRVPGLDKEHVLRWIASLAGPPLELDAEDARLVAEVAEWNPRQIKRLLNNVRIQLCTARHDIGADSRIALASTLLLHRRPEAWLSLTQSATLREEVARVVDRT